MPLAAKQIPSRHKLRTSHLKLIRSCPKLIPSQSKQMPSRPKLIPSFPKQISWVFKQIPSRHILILSQNEYMPSEKNPISPWNNDVPRPVYRERAWKSSTRVPSRFRRNREATSIMKCRFAGGGVKPRRDCLSGYLRFASYFLRASRDNAGEIPWPSPLECYTKPMRPPTRALHELHDSHHSLVCNLLPARMRQRRHIKRARAGRTTSSEPRRRSVLRVLCVQHVARRVF